MGAQNYSFEVTFLREIILYKADFETLTVLNVLCFCVSLADLCALLINTFEKLPIINSEANLRPPQHLQGSFFVTLVNFVN